MLNRRLLACAPRHSRSISLFDNVKKILGRTTAPPSPLPSNITENSTPASDDASAEIAAREKVGKQKRNKVIGFDLSTPTRLTGPEFTTALTSALTQVLGEDSAVSESKKLSLAKSIMEQTGRRIPDAVLNAAQDKQDIVKHFQTEDARGQKRLNVLQFDVENLPENVRIGT